MQNHVFHMVPRTFHHHHLLNQAPLTHATWTVSSQGTTRILSPSCLSMMLPVSVREDLISPSGSTSNITCSVKICSAYPLLICSQNILYIFYFTSFTSYGIFLLICMYLLLISKFFESRVFNISPYHEWNMMLAWLSIHSFISSFINHMYLLSYLPYVSHIGLVTRDETCSKLTVEWINE